MAQTIDYDIHLLIEDNSDVKLTEIENDTMVFQIFRFKEQLQLNDIEYLINKNGKLTVHIKTKGSNRLTTISLNHVNTNNKNKPFIIKKTDVNNILKYPSDFRGAKLENIYNLLKNAKQLFLIESDNTLGYYLVKKVKMEQRLGGL